MLLLGWKIASNTRKVDNQQDDVKLIISRMMHFKISLCFGTIFSEMG